MGAIISLPIKKAASIVFAAFYSDQNEYSSNTHSGNSRFRRCSSICFLSADKQ